MLEKILDDNKNLKACLEWYLCNEKGELDDKGRYVWVNDVYINPEYRNNGILKKFVAQVINKCPQAQYCYFYRRKKYPDRGTRLYPKRLWTTLIKGEKNGIDIK